MRHQGPGLARAGLPSDTFRPPVFASHSPRLASLLTLSQISVLRRPLTRALTVRHQAASVFRPLHLVNKMKVLS